MSAILDDLQDEYQDGDEWDERYESDVLGSGRDDEGFAYMISDEIFGNLDYEILEDSDVYDMRVGDVVYRYDEEIYMIVLDVDRSDDTFTYLYLDEYNEICWEDRDWLDIDDWDTVYTRYPDGVSSSDDTLSDGKDVTTRNVQNLIDDFLADEYDEGEEWNDTYRSDVMSDGDRVTGSEAFAYYMSDYIFGDLEVTRSDIDSIAVGDVIELDETGDDDEWIYCVVTDVDDEYVDYIYAEYDESDDTYYIVTDNQKLSRLDSDRDIVFTRYPD